MVDAPWTDTWIEGLRRTGLLTAREDAPRIVEDAAKVALEGVPHLSALPEGFGRWAFDVSMKATHGYGDKIRAALQARGVSTNEWWSERSPFRNLAAWRDDHDRYERTLLDDIASLAPSNETGASPLDRDCYRSLTSVGDLLAATNYARVSVQEFSRAFVHDDTATRRGWLDAIADAYCIDKAGAAREAAWMLDQLSQSIGGERGLNDHWFVASMSRQRGPALDGDAVARLAREQHDALLGSLRADSDWIAWPAAEVLINVPVAAWDAAQLFASDMTGWPLDRAAPRAMESSTGSRQPRLPRPLNTAWPPNTACPSRENSTQTALSTLNCGKTRI